MTGAAALLGAIGALIAGLAAAGVFGGSDGGTSQVSDREPRGILYTVRFHFRPDDRVTEFRTFMVANVPPDTEFAVSCEGSGCFDGVKRMRVSSGAREVRLSDLKTLRLGRKAVLEVRATRPGALDTIKRVALRKNGVPIITTVCRRPGSLAADVCPG